MSTGVGTRPKDSNVVRATSFCTELIVRLSITRHLSTSSEGSSSPSASVTLASGEVVGSVVNGTASAGLGKSYAGVGSPGVAPPDEPLELSVLVVSSAGGR